MVDAIAVAKKFKLQLKKYQRQRQFSQIADLVTYALKILPSDYNRQIFGYIPGLFRQVELNASQIEVRDLFWDEPVVYKVFYSDGQALYGMSYFYIFCYLKQKYSSLNVYFQSAHPKFAKLSQAEYELEQSKIGFEGSISAFNSDNISTISISDPGHFVPGLTSSYYLGSAELNFNLVIARVLEEICSLANLSPNRMMLFGSSAGSFGALLSSTFFKEKTNVLAVNSQIFLHYRNHLMNSLFGIDRPQQLIEKFGDRVSCLCRFQQEINSVPNIYILANINDRLHQRNWEFYQLYIKRYTSQGIDNQSVFDSYYGVEGHGRPEPSSLKFKIRIARETLTMKSTFE